MRTLGQISSRAVILLLVATGVCAATWLVGNHYSGGAMPAAGGERAFVAAQSTTDASNSDVKVASPSEQFGPREDGRERGGNLGFGLLGLLQNAAMILAIVLLVVGLERLFVRKGSPASLGV